MPLPREPSPVDQQIYLDGSGVPWGRYTVLTFAIGRGRVLSLSPTDSMGKCHAGRVVD